MDAKDATRSFVESQLRRQALALGMHNWQGDEEEFAVEVVEATTEELGWAAPETPHTRPHSSFSLIVFPD
jgi:hypothetical protein